MKKLISLVLFSMVCAVPAFASCEDGDVIAEQAVIISVSRGSARSLGCVARAYGVKQTRTGEKHEVVLRCRVRGGRGGLVPAGTYGVTLVYSKEDAECVPTKVVRIDR